MLNPFLVEGLSTVVRFRPTSTSDFSRYAKALSYVIEEPWQVGQDILAKAYGFVDLHALQQEMKRPGDPGPYSPDIDEHTSQPLGPEYGATRTARNDWLLRLVSGWKGLSRVGELDSRYALVTGLELFSRPPVHRAAFRNIRARLRKFQGTADGSVKRTGSEPSYNAQADYVSWGTDMYGGAIPLFTSEGQVIFASFEWLLKHVDEENIAVFGPYDEEDEDEFEGAEGLLATIEDHPDFIWLPAKLIAQQAPLYLQDGWAQHLPVGPDGFGSEDARPQYRAHQRENSLLLLPYLQATVEDFREFYAGITNLASWQEASHRADTRAWPELLYWGGRIAMNAGKPEWAISMLKEHMSLVPDDNFGARYPLSALYLTTGRGSVLSLWPENYRDAWGHLAVAAEQAAAGAFADAGESFGHAAVAGWAVLEAFNKEWKACRRLRVMVNHDSPAFIQEFSFLTESFWQRNPRVHSFFESIAGMPEVLETAEKFHALRDTNLKNAREVRGQRDAALQRRNQEAEGRKRLREAVTAAIPLAIEMSTKN
jgi:hypothetical protein